MKALLWNLANEARYSPPFLFHRYMLGLSQGLRLSMSMFTAGCRHDWMIAFRVQSSRRLVLRQSCSASAGTPPAAVRSRYTTWPLTRPCSCSFILITSFQYVIVSIATALVFFLKTHVCDHSYDEVFYKEIYSKSPVSVLHNRKK